MYSFSDATVIRSYNSSLNGLVKHFNGVIDMVHWLLGHYSFFYYAIFFMDLVFVACTFTVKVFFRVWEADC